MTGEFILYVRRLLRRYFADLGRESTMALPTYNINESTADMNDGKNMNAYDFSLFCINSVYEIS